jgi:hypothetical protein
MHDRIEDNLDFLSSVLIKLTCCDDFYLHNEAALLQGHNLSGYGGETSRHQSLAIQSREHQSPSSRLDKQEADAMAY